MIQNNSESLLSGSIFKKKIDHAFTERNRKLKEELDTTHDSATDLYRLLMKKNSGNEITDKEMDQLSELMESTIELTDTFRNDIIEELDEFCYAQTNLEDLRKNVDKYEEEIEVLKKQIEIHNNSSKIKEE